MFFKEKRKKVDLYLSTEEKLNKKLEKLHEVEEKLNSTNNELDEVNNKLQLSKEELEKYKREALEIKDYVDSKFLEDYKDSKKLIDIKDCYIIKIGNKRYIACRVKKTRRGDVHSVATGWYHYDYISYYDFLNTKVSEDGSKYPTFICKYTKIWTDNNYFGDKYLDDVPDEETHILEVFPELRTFSNGLVPEECLKKAYYEVNDLGSIDKSKILIKK